MIYKDIAGVIPRPFGKRINNTVEKYAIKMFPAEACGVIHDDGNGYVFTPCENIAKDPFNHFEIDARTVAKIINKSIDKPNNVCIWHSHPDSLYGISEHDMQSQMLSPNIPWGISYLDKNGECNATSTFYYGDTLPITGLIGRPFIHGIYDCYSLARDYYRLNGINIKDFPRPDVWWELSPDNKKSNMYVDFMTEAGFRTIDPSNAKIGDVALASILSNVENHAAVIVESGLILHHLHNRLSQRQPHLMYDKFMNRVISRIKS